MPDYNYFPAKRPEPKAPTMADLGLGEPPRVIEMQGEPEIPRGSNVIGPEHCAIKPKRGGRKGKR